MATTSAYSAWHEFYRKWLQPNVLERTGPLQRLHLHMEGDGVLVVLERRVSTTVGNDGVVHELWAVLTAFRIAGHRRISTAELWQEAWIHTGKREYGERVPER